MKDCKQAREAIRRGDSIRITEHIESCDACASFAEAYAFIGETAHEEIKSEDIQQLLGRVKSQMSGQTSIRRRLAELSTSKRFLIALISVAAVILYVAVLKNRVDIDIYPRIRFLAESGAIGLVVFLHLWFLIRPLHLAHPGPFKRVALVVTTIAVISIPFVLPLPHTDHPESLKGIGTDLLPRAAACFAWGTVLGIALGAVGFLLSRGAKSVLSSRAALWLSSAMAAELALHLHCPIVHPEHIALGHTSIVAGAWIAVFALYLRKRRRFLKRDDS